MAYSAYLQSSLGNGYRYLRAILVSGTQHVSQSSCVRLSLYYVSGVSLGVRVPRCVTSARDDGLLLYVMSWLGDACNLWLPLDVDVTDSGCNAQLQFEVTYDVTVNQGSVNVANVAVNSGRCMGKYYVMHLNDCNLTSFGYFRDV